MMAMLAIMIFILDMSRFGVGFKRSHNLVFLLTAEGVLQAERDYNLPKHPELPEVCYRMARCSRKTSPHSLLPLSGAQSPGPEAHAEL